MSRRQAKDVRLKARATEIVPFEDHLELDGRVSRPDRVLNGLGSERMTDKTNRLATTLLPALVILVGLAAFGGCAKKQKPPAVTPPTSDSQSTGSQTGTTGDTGTGDTGDSNSMTELGLQDIFFDYDRSVLREDARRLLDGNARQLLEGSSVVILEGHCDERGTTEYNLALGERRAHTARDYMVQYGVSGSRLRSVSFGEERPFDPGHDERAWSQNRRVHFVAQ